MKKLWVEHKIKITVAISIVAVALFTYFGVFSLIGDIKENSKEIQKRIIDNEIFQSKLKQLPEKQKEVELFKEREKDLNVIISSDQEVDFIKKLETLSKETGNKISLKAEENKNIKNEKNADDIKSNLPSNGNILMNVSLEGKYENVLNFIHKLENSDSYANVISLDIKKLEADAAISQNGGLFAQSDVKTVSHTGDISASIEVVVYIKK